MLIQFEKDFKIWIRVDWRHQRISPGSTFSPSQTTSWPALLRYSEDPTIQPVTKNFLGTMALRYSAVPSKSCKQAMAVGKWTIKASRISIWLAECSQSSCRHLKTTANRLLILPATQANVTRRAGLEIKKSSGCLLANNWRNIVARCKFLVSSFYNVNDAAQGLEYFARSWSHEVQVNQ